MKKVTILLFLFINYYSIDSVAQYERRMVAEWEPAFGTLIRWPLGIPSELVVELAEDDSLYVLVDNPVQQLQAETQFENWDVNMDHCRFLTIDTYSHWTRDWGPHYVFNENGVGSIADPIFDGYPWVPGCNYNNKDREVSSRSKGYEEDDAVNIALANEFDIPLIDLPYYLTGGNIMTDGHGQAVSTVQMLDENAQVCDEQCFMTTNADSMGLNNYWITENPETHGIQHMDCYAKFLDEEKVLVKSVESWHPEYQCCEDLANFYATRKSCYGRYYEVIRIHCGIYYGTEVAAYTNSLILNTKVLVPTFGIDTDQQAIDTYRDAMPGYEIIGIYYPDWYYYDALHCRTMAIFDHEMLRIWHKPVSRVAADSPVEIIALIDDRSNTGLIDEELRVYYRVEGNGFWTYEYFETAYGQDSFNVLLPSFPDGTLVEYYISAADSSGRFEQLPRTAPIGYYSFEATNLIVGLEETEPDFEVSILSRTIQINTNTSERYQVEIVDAFGRVVYLNNHNDSFTLHKNLNDGIYIVRLKTKSHQQTEKLFIGN